MSKKTYNPVKSFDDQHRVFGDRVIRSGLIFKYINTMYRGCYEELETDSFISLRLVLHYPNISRQRTWSR